MTTGVWNRRRILLILLALAALFAVVCLALYWWLLADLPSVRAVELRAVRPTSQILDRNGKLLYEVVDPDAGKQIDLSLAGMPAACIQATLATEDHRFFEHPGVDVIAIARAGWQNLRGGTVVSGGSTLTQQLARNLLLSPGERYTQSLRRKLREAWLAWQLEFNYTKDQLLALYLNQTYYGNFAFGIEAAAQIFFAKPANQLSQAECALLAGLVQYPSGYNPLQDPETAKNRQLTVLRLMQDAGYLSAAASAEIAKEPLHYRSRLFAIEAPHFVMHVQDLLTEQLGAERLRDGGLRVVTTLDVDLQHQAEAAMRRRLDLLTCRAPGLCDERTARNRRIDNAAAIVLDSHTGEILAMVGSPDYFDPAISGNVNAALALRQPGSAIKPFTYAAALDPAWSSQSGQPPLTPASILPDLPATFYVNEEDGSTAAYRPQNYDRTYHGPVSVRTALANSYNIPAVHVLDRVGVEALRDLATQAGIRSFSGRYGLALTLGGGEVRLLELTSAFGIFDDGSAVEPRAILEIGEGEEESSTVNSQQSIVNGQTPPNNHSQFTIHNSQFLLSPTHPVISPQAAYLITDILADDVARRPAFGANSVLKLPFPAAVKTGTTTDWRDNWTVGYSTQRIVGVWVGNADNTPMVDVSGVDGAGPIWHDIMLLAHPTPPPAFVQPENIVETQICAPSGMLPSRDCPRTRWERFIAGTEPRAVDTQFQRIAIDLSTGQAATETTPANRRAERVYWLLPPEYHDWMVGQGIAMAPGRGEERGARGEEEIVNCQLSIVNCQLPARPSPLVLTGPASFTAYRVHPGMPQQSQRLEVAGYVGDGSPWHSLRLVVDGTVIVQATDAARLSGWWALQLGSHRFWLEGEREAGSSTERSPEAQIRVEEFRTEIVGG